MFFRNQKLRAGKSYDFNYDTVGWEWYQHDAIAILGKGDKVVKKWVFAVGKVFYQNNRVWEFKQCPACGGTGICQTCHVPRRKPRFGGTPFA